MTVTDAVRPDFVTFYCNAIVFRFKNISGLILIGMELPIIDDMY